MDLHWRCHSDDNALDELVISLANDTSGRFGTGRGYTRFFCNLLLMFLMTLVVAVSIRSVGILLISPF